MRIRDLVLEAPTNLSQPLGHNRTSNSEKLIYAMWPLRKFCYLLPTPAAFWVSHRGKVYTKGKSSVYVSSHNQGAFSPIANRPIVSERLEISPERWSNSIQNFMTFLPGRKVSSLTRPRLHMFPSNASRNFNVLHIQRFVNVYRWFVHTYVFASCAFLVPMEARSKHRISWNWN